MAKRLGGAMLRMDLRMHRREADDSFGAGIDVSA